MEVKSRTSEVEGQTSNVDEVMVSVQELAPPVGGLEAQEAWDLAVKLHRLGLSRTMFLAGFTPVAYVEITIKAVEDLHAITPRVRSYMERLARRDWMLFDRDIDPAFQQRVRVDLIHHTDIRRARGGALWYTKTVYTQGRAITRRNHPAPDSVADALHKLRDAGWTVRSYGATWHRAWPGKPAPVRDRNGIWRARQLLADGKFYVPKDFKVAHSQIDFAYDL
jgi:hypothetical protein